MRAAIVICILLCSALLINWLREGESFPIVQTLPFLGGHDPGLYDFGGLVLLGLAVWGALRLKRLWSDRDD